MNGIVGSNMSVVWENNMQNKKHKVPEKKKSMCDMFRSLDFGVHFWINQCCLRCFSVICRYHSRCLTVVHRSHGYVSLIPTFLKMTGITEDFLELTVTVDPPNQKKHKTYMRLKLCLWSSGSPKSLQHERKGLKSKISGADFQLCYPPEV